MYASGSQTFENGSTFLLCFCSVQLPEVTDDDNNTSHLGIADPSEAHPTSGWGLVF